MLVSGGRMPRCGARHRPGWAVALLAATLTSAFAATLATVRPAVAQDPSDVRIGLTYRPGYVPVLVMPDVRAGPGLDEVARAVDEIVRTDLEYSDRFEILQVPDSLRTGGPINYGLWNQLGAVWLVTADVSGTPSAPILRVGLHDVVYGDLENVQAFTLPAPTDEGFRMAVHRASDAVVGWATEGEPGIAATRIAFRRRMADGTSQIFIVDSDGHNLRRLTGESGLAYSPSFSPDGSRLLYQVQSERGEQAVYELNLHTGRRRVVSAEPGLNLTPTYTPSGGIALARSAGGGTEVFHTEGGRLTNTGTGDALNPSFAPDGSRFAFEATPLGQQQVYVQSTRGGAPRLISVYVHGERASAAGPDWSPRGDRIAYAGWVDGRFQIFSVNPDGSDRRALTSRGNNEDPSWAPDGRHLVFASETRQGHRLLILDTVSGNTRVLTSGQVDQVPAWSGPLPEGR